MTDLFMPHGMCFQWRADVLFLHVISDGIIAASYFSIPLALLVFVRRRTDLEYKWILPLFAAFIVLCGVTHVFGIWVVWNPDYWIEGISKAATAGVSVATALILWPLIPKLLALPNPSELRDANRRLQQENAARLSVQRELEELNARLEERVASRTEALARSNEDLEKFAYHASHDLKAPMRAIHQFSQLLERDLGDEGDRGRMSIEQIQKSVSRMQSMLDSLLEYGRVGRETPDSEVEVEVEVVNGRDLLDDVVQLVSPPESTEITISGEFSGARFERMPLQQVLLNLVNNAIKHNDRPRGHVRIDLEETATHHVISVEDDGPGIAAQFHDDIFQMFTTLPGKDREGNGGLGLAIVKKIIDRRGGRIVVESGPERGATFKVYWPKEASGR